MLDLYWRYVTEGVVDIKTYYQTSPNISASCESRDASEEGQLLPVVVGSQAPCHCYRCCTAEELERLWYDAWFISAHGIPDA